MQYAASIDLDIAQIGKNVLLFLNLRPILATIADYLSENIDDNNEIVQIAITNFLSKVNPNIAVTQQAIIIAKAGAESFIASKEGMPIIWVTEGKHLKVKEVMAKIFADKPFGLSETEIYKTVPALSKDLGVTEISLFQYMAFRNARILTPPVQITGEGDLIDEALKNLLEEQIKELLTTLSDTRQQLFELRYYQNLTVRQAGEAMGISEDRVVLLENKALRTLRHHVQFRFESINPYLDTGSSRESAIRFPSDQRFGRIIPNRTDLQT